MNLKRIEATRIKGGSFKHDLGPITIVHGRNMAGKTAVLDAVKLAMLGYHPSLGKLPGATMQLASGDIMSVKLTLENDGKAFWFDREWTRKKDGGASLTKDEGPSFTVPAVLLDIGEFLKLTGDQRLAAVFKCVPDIRVQDEIVKIVKRVRSIEVAPLKLAEKVAEEICVTLNRNTLSEEGDVAAWFDDVTDQLKGGKRNADVDAKRVKAQLESDMNAMRGQARPEDVTAAVAAFEAEVFKAQQEAAYSSASVQAWERRKELLAKSVGMKVDVERVKAQIAKLEPELNQRRRNANIDREEKAGPALRKLDDLRSCSATLVTQIEWLEKGKIEQRERLTRVLKNDDCPTCGAPGSQWKKTVVALFEAKLNAAEKEIYEKHAQYRKLLDQLKEADAEWKAACKLDGEAEVESHKLTYDKATLENNRTLLDTLTIALEKHEKEIAALPNKAPENDAVLQSRLNDLRSKLADLKPKANAHAIWKSRKANVEKLEEELIEKQCRAEVFKDAVEIIQQVRLELVEAACRPLLDKASVFTMPVLGFRLGYQDGRFGKVEAQRFIPLETLSGSESMLAMAGMSLALCADSPLKVVMMDELGRLTEENKDKLINTARALTQGGTITAFIGVDVESDSYRYFDDIHFIKVV